MFNTKKGLKKRAQFSFIIWSRTKRKNVLKSLHRDLSENQNQKLKKKILDGLENPMNVASLAQFNFMGG